MKVEAGTPEAGKYRLVWHVPMCRALTNVKWVDDETQQYCTYTFGLDFPAYQTHQAKKIELRPKEGAIFIDPIEGLNEEALVTDKAEDVVLELQGIL